MKDLKIEPMKLIVSIVERGQGRNMIGIIQRAKADTPFAVRRKGNSEPLNQRFTRLGRRGKGCYIYSWQGNRW